MYQVLPAIASLIILISWIIAIRLDKTWKFGSSFYSDLGISEVKATRYLFNISSIVGGILFIIFSIVTMLVEKFTTFGILAWIPVIFMGFLIMMIGVFDENHKLHWKFAWGFFITSILVTCMIIFLNIVEKEFILATIYVLILLACLYFKLQHNNELAETVSGILLFVVLAIQFFVYINVLSLSWITAFIHVPW